ncbi:MAG: hypothetical protein ACSHX0_04925 [Akkermansiaceae bacterium]
MKHFHTSHSISGSMREGFASILTVLSIGAFLMIILVSMYKTTVESQLTVKNNSLRGDYQQREEAFLRAMVANTPNVAIKCMKDNSLSDPTLTGWQYIIENSIIHSNAQTAVNENNVMLTDLNLIAANTRKGNVGDTGIDTTTGLQKTLTWNTVVTPNLGAGSVSPGVQFAGSVDYPAPLTATQDAIRDIDRNFPLITHKKSYATHADQWVGASVVAYPQYNLVPTPSSHFNYNNSDTLIAKHNWWSFNLNLAAEDAGTTNLTNQSKQYILSIYEVPSQLALSANSAATFGAHSDGLAWGADISIGGAVFAEELSTTGDFAIDSVTSRRGVTLSGGTTFNNSTITGDESTSAGSNPMASDLREYAQSAQTTFPISASSDGGRVAFIPINRDISFYDRFAGQADMTAANAVTVDSINAVSPTSWNYYSNGAHQCAINVDITGVSAAANQTPTSLQIRYLVGGVKVTLNPSTLDGTWPSPTSSEGLLFPFHTSLAGGSPRINVYMDRLEPYLQNLGADPPTINNSLSINADYTDSVNTDIQNPSTDYDTANSIILKNAQDLSSYTNGFSLVSNMRLIFDGAFNTTALDEADLPTGYEPPTGDAFHPPVSIFSPEKRYGNRLGAVPVEVNGQIGSIGLNGAGTVNLLDLKSGTGGIVDINNISADLTSITHPGALPPINMMNWMVVVREK